jgi:hypothetical protein
MQITIDTERATPRELTALALLLAELNPNKAAVSHQLELSLGVDAAAIRETLSRVRGDAPAIVVGPDNGDEDPSTPSITATIGLNDADVTPAQLVELTAEGAPADSPNAPTPPPSAVRDADGLPWDARIHATASGGGGVLTQAGKWRAKRGVSDELVAQVTAELKGYAGQPAPEVTVPPPPAAPPVPPPPLVGVLQTPFAAPAPVEPPPFDFSAVPTPPPFTPDVPVPPVAPSPAEPAAPAGGVSFPDLCRELGRMQETGAVTPMDVADAVKRYGKQSLGQLTPDAEAFSRANMLADLRALAASKGVA